MKPAFALRAAFLLLLSALVASSASALEPSRASDLVTLVANVEGTCPIAGMPIDTRVLADGSQVPFTLPPKRVLVITGFEFVRSGLTAGAGTGAVVSQQPAGAVLASPLLQASGIAGSNGFVSGSAVAEPGIAVRGEAPLCLGGADAGIVRGFLAKDK
jgi:hypothetical protein